MNTIGRKFRISIFGESHGELIGVVMDGVPAGLELSEADFEQDILRRKSGAKGTTPRIEADLPKIVSGIYEGHTTGAPLTVTFQNTDTHSSDYELFAAMPRPGHADLTAALKWDDCQDPRGGGHFSGRLTLPVVAAGVVAKKILTDATILDETPFTGVSARIVELGGKILHFVQNDNGKMPEEWQEAIDEAIKEGDSLGAVIECVVPNIDPGYGEPFWDGLEAVLAHAIFSIPGVRGLEFGDGFEAARMKGSKHNDPIGEDGRPLKNGAGGANGGITNGAPISFRVAFKPTSSIRKAQQTFNFQTGEMDTLEVPGRHDVCFALRAPVVVEAMTAITLADLVLMK
ncbi:MAG: chorismate synthase [Bacteroidales bacterium]|nr:chorismate synthase [Bacteroidales bacterium]MBQ6879097.1 chorismate synthase [Bacteroidales bacterium]